MLCRSDEPDGRGTFGIIRSCLFTLALCVYTSLHLNIVAVDEGKIALFLRKAKWAIMAILAPELVVYVAWCQKQEVKELHKTLTSHLDRWDSKQADPEKKRKHPWTITHSWYAYMGGFALDMSIVDEDRSGRASFYEEEETSSRLALLPEGLYLLADAGLLPDMSKRTIEDKSKADSWAKLLVITQSSWMLLECVVRWSAGLFVTGLELNTLAHAVCSFFIYLMWWQKPLDINEPTTLSGDWVNTAATVLWYCRSQGERSYLRDRFFMHNLGWVSLDDLPPDLEDSDGGDGPQQPGPSPSSRDSACFVANDEWKDKPVDLSCGTLRIFDLVSKKYSTLHRTRPSGEPRFLVPRNNAVVILSGVGVRVLGPPGIMIGGNRVLESSGRETVHQRHLMRWQVISDWLKSAPEVRTPPFPMHIIRKELEAPQHPLSSSESVETASLSRVRSFAYTDASSNANKGSHHHPKRFFAERVSNWRFSRVNNTAKDIASAAVFFGCALSYGGIHAAAWNDHFPTEREHMLWRVSCIYLVAYGGLMFSLVWISYAARRQRFGNLPWFLRWLDRPLSWLVKVYQTVTDTSEGDSHFLQLQMWFLLVLLQGYVIARSFLVVEAFIGLRRCPPSVYQTAEWVGYLIHV